MIYSKAQFEHEAPPRIMGSETEYTTDAIPFDRQLNRFLPSSSAFYREDTRDDGVELWLENGARLYLDGAMLEYATPECLGAAEVALAERAGELIVSQLCHNAAEWMRGHEEADVRGKVYKRSGYSEVEVGDRFKMLEMSAGHHENYLSSISGAGERAPYYHPSVSAFLATRSVWAGAGLVTADGFEFSQKGRSTTFMTATGKLNTYGQKSAYNIHMEDDDLYRLEVRVGDGNMSPAAIERKYAATSLVLRMIEHGSFPDALRLREDRTDISSYNASRGVPVIMQSNRSMGAALHQARVLEAALSFADGVPGIPADEIKAALEAYEICRIVDGAERLSDISYQLSDSVDWAAKHAFMMSHGIDPISTKNLEAVAADLRWEDVAQAGNSRTWYASGESSLDDELRVLTATSLPPTTRAMARTAVLESLPDHPRSIKWHRIESADRRLYKFDDPYDALTSGRET